MDNSWPITERVSTLADILCRSRDWHRDLQLRFCFSSVVKYVLDQGHIPVNWHLLTLEWPHQSEVDPNMISYTQTEAKARRDLQTRTKPGRYLKRHFPHLQDHVIRDALLRVGRHFAITNDHDEMIRITQGGPYSCMQLSSRDLNEHPYQVYRPDLGWALAYCMTDGVYEGRALVYQQGHHKCFVRTFGKDYDEASHKTDAHLGLTSWLKEQGYCHQREGWPIGARIAVIKDPDESYLLPYIDGDNCFVSELGHGLFEISNDGEWECRNTDGTADEAPTQRCEMCGDRMTEDDSCTVGRHEDMLVCQSCLHSNFSLVEACGRSGRGTIEYYVRDENAVDSWFGNVKYDVDHLPPGIVMLENGEACHNDYVVTVCGDYYHEDDSRVIRGLDGEWRLKADCTRLSLVSNYAGQYVPDEDVIVTFNGDEIVEDEAVELDWPPEKAGRTMAESQVTRVTHDDHEWIVLDEDVDNFNAEHNITEAVPHCEVQATIEAVEV